MKLAGISEQGNLVSIDIQNVYDRISIEYSSSHNQVIDSFDKSVSLDTALSRMKLVLCDEKYGL